MVSTNPRRRASSQFLRELHFIEARRHCGYPLRRKRRSSFGNCTSLRFLPLLVRRDDSPSQFLWELHFIEAGPAGPPHRPAAGSQFLRELHFIEAVLRNVWGVTHSSRSSFGNCTSLRLSTCARYYLAPRTRSSFGNCTSLRQGYGATQRAPRRSSQFLRELHFIEASPP